MTVDGRQVRGRRTIPVINPAKGTPFALAPDCDQQTLDAAVAAAQRSFADWSSDEGARRAALVAAAELLKLHLDDIATVLTTEQGKPLRDARVEILGCRRWMKYFAGLELPGELLQDDEHARVELVRRPVGPTAAITAWNFPLTLMCWKIAPALLAGNTVIVKPSPYTPLSTLLVGSLFADVFPPGVLNVISGADPLGARLAAHPGVRKISFTGSTPTGKAVARAAAEDLKRLTLELGGNDAAIVLDDAEPAEIADSLFWGAFSNCGQICMAIKRVYVPDSLYDETVDALAAVAEGVVVGDGADESTQMGPLNNAAQRQRVIDLVSDARASGARTAAGGTALDRDGYFYAPTIVADVDHGTALVDEEQFGPALPVLRYRDLDEAVEAANRTSYGLGGSVWSSDRDRARSVAARLECGSAWVNSHTVLQPHQPFGGLKWSGLGVENGPWGVHGFTDMQVLYTPKA